MQLAQIKFSCDIIVLSETKLKTKFPSNIYHLNGYDKYCCCRDAKNSGGGLLVFIKKEIFIKLFSKSSTTFEKIKMVIHINDTDYKILCYYRNPIYQSLEPFLTDIECELQESMKTIIIGDINLDANADNKDSKRYMSILKSYSYEVTNTIQTRNESNRIIDHLAVNFTERNNIANYTIHNRLSDHNAIITDICNLSYKRKAKIVEKVTNNWIKFRETFITLSMDSNVLEMSKPN